VAGLFSGGTALLDKGFSWLLGLAGAILSRMPDSALTVGTALISGVMISARLPRIRKWIALRFPRERLRPLLQTLRQMKTAVGGWLLAQLRLAGVTLMILLAGFLILRIPYGPLWAVGVALVDAFPVLGTGTVLVPWSLVCFLQGDHPQAIGLLGIYTVAFLARTVLEPRLVGGQLGLDPLMTLVALYAGYKVWGIGGMLVAPLLCVTVMELINTKKEPS
jgi:predicted PurR-regulated permease PerM